MKKPENQECHRAVAPADGPGGSGAVFYQLRQAEQANHAFRTVGEISNEDYAIQRKVAEAYF